MDMQGKEHSARDAKNKSNENTLTVETQVLGIGILIVVF